MNDDARKIYNNLIRLKIKQNELHRAECTHAASRAGQHEETTEVLENARRLIAALGHDKEKLTREVAGQAKLIESLAKEIEALRVLSSRTAEERERYKQRMLALEKMFGIRSVGGTSPSDEPGMSPGGHH